MDILWISLIIIGIAVFLMCFNLIFRKGKSFPDGEIGHNRELRKRGIICAKEEELKIWGKKKKQSAICTDQECSICGVSDCLAKSLNDKK
jgi:hypothetical protein